MALALQGNREYNDEEIVIERPDGSRRTTLAHANPFRDERGNLTGAVNVLVDITDRKRAEQQLRRSEQELADFFENAAVGLHWVGPDGIILRANRAELNLLGYSADEYVGHHIAEFHADQDVIADILRRLQAGEELHDYEARLRCKDGSVRHVLINSNALWEDGRFIHTRCFTRDITEHKRTAEAHVRLAAIVESSDDAIIGKDMSGTITSWNRGAERLYGYTAEEIVGRSISCLMPPDHTDDFPMLMRRLSRGERIEHYETVRVRKDGSRVDVSLTISPIKNAEGQVVGASKIARDITERKRAEEALRESEERFRGIFKQTIAGVAQTDLTGRFVQVNERYGAIVGRSAEELYGLRMQDITHPDDLPRNLPLFERAVTQGTPFVIDKRYVRPDGSLVWVSNSVSPIRDGLGNPKYVVAVCLDITDRKRAEDALREADRRKDEFLAILAHELRNPLAPLRNALQLLQLDSDNKATFEQARAMMERQLQQMVRLVDDLMDVSRIAKGKLALRKERVELAAVVQSAVEAARPLIEQHDHTLTVTLPPEPVFLHGDQTRLAQVFSNLLTNAAKYMDRGGRIWLSAAREGDEVVVKVRDAGVGIPADMLGKIFEPFTQVDRSLERSQGGLGIGLSLVRGLIAMHGGSIEAHSDGPGRGSEFIVRLPVLVGGDSPIPQTNGSAKGESRPKCRILVVDDNKDSAASLALMLELTGHDTRAAHDGLAAVKAAEEFRPDVVLLDIGLPKLNGYAAARQIREQAWGQAMFLIAVTGWGQDEDKRRSAEAGFDLHMVKPVDPVALENLLVGLRRNSA
jgi:PAS domain S-box-containing protein